MSEQIEQTARVDAEMRGSRLDQVAAELFPDFSRSRLQGWIKDGSLTLNGAAAKQRDKVDEGDELALSAVSVEEVSWGAESIALDIVYEDDSVLVINKPAGLVVHPAAGHQSGTLVNALLHHRPELANLPRGGIVHRLDMDTSGLLVVATSLQAHAHLVEQLQDRSVSREYAAVCIGAMTGGGTVDLPIGRHPRARKKMAVLGVGGKEAITHYRIAKRFKNHTHITVKLETGRTHQIRVHMAHQKYPLVGDKTYGGRPRLPRGADPELVDMLRGFNRQALHAQALGIIHPRSLEYLEWKVDLPADMKALLKCLAEFDVD